MSGAHVHFEEDALLEAALDPQARALRREVAACAECARRSAQLATFASRVRGALLATEDAEPERQRAFAERVLARTTREDLSRRGDLSLVARFAVERLRASVLLRAAAALLVIHLAALPVLAWIVLRAPRPSGQFTSHIEQPKPSAFANEAESEPERTLSAPLPEGDPRTLEVDPPALDGEPWQLQLRRADRAAHAAAAPPPWTSTPPQDGLALFLWLRASRLRGQEVPEWLWSQQPDGAPSRLALWAEILLDEWALGDARPLYLDTLLARLLALPEFQRSRLVGCALQRAAALGALPPARVAEHAQLESGASEIARRAAREPLERLWREALADHREPSSPEREAALTAWGAAPR